MAAPPLRVGIVGYGSLGQFLVERIQNEPSIEIAWVWNRSPNKIPPTLPVLEDLADFGSRHADLIVEVAHPDITRLAVLLKYRLSLEGTKNHKVGQTYRHARTTHPP